MDGQRDNTTVDVIIAALLPYRILDNGLDMQRGRVSVQRIGRRIKAGRQFDMGLGVIQDIFLQKKTSSYTWNNLVGSAYSAVLILRTSSQSTEVNNKCATDGQKHCSQCIEKSKIAIEI